MLGCEFTLVGYDSHHLLAPVDFRDLVFSVHLISIDFVQEVIDNRGEAPWVSDQKIIRAKVFLGLLEFVAAK